MKKIKNFDLYEVLLRKSKNVFYMGVLVEFKNKNLNWKTKWWIDKVFTKNDFIDDDAILSIIPYLFRDGFVLDSEIVDNTYPPLHSALVVSSNIKIVQLLLDLGARVDAVDCFGRTALFLCSTPAAAQLILDAGADIEHRDSNAHNAIEAILDIVATNRAGLMREPLSDAVIDSMLDTVDFLNEYVKSGLIKDGRGLPEAGERVRLGGRI